MNVDQIIEKLKLLPHPEGGYYQETYRATHSALYNDNFFQNEERSYSTGIFFLLVNNNFSAWHRIKSDEMWHYYTGTASLLVHEIDAEGHYRVTELNCNFHHSSIPQYVVRAGNWFASEIKNRDGYALVGCTVSPGFDFKDFEIAKRKNLSKLFPQHQNIIQKLTR